MGPNGRTFYYSDYRLGGGRKVYHPDTFPCCSGTYIEAVADYHNLIYFKDASSLYVNLFVPSEVTWNRDGSDIKVEQETSYPEADTTTLTMRPAKPTAFDLKVRVPRWCHKATAEVNGKPAEFAASPDGWATLHRTWNPGDRVTVRLAMEPYLAPIDKQHPNRVAVMSGPVVLVRKQESLKIPDTKNLAQWLNRGGNPLKFRASSRSSSTFVPFFQVGLEEPYIMYFDLEV
jgi:hypothetical protein